MSSGPAPSASSPAGHALAVGLATVSFGLCFAAWGLIAALAPAFRDLYDLGETQTALLVALPVLAGSVARLPMGVLADRYGGRAMFTALLLLVAVATAAVPQTTSYGQLVAVGVLVGLAGSSFAVGVAFVAAWTPARRQGGALGIYSLGNAGQSAAVFLAPVAAALYGWPVAFRTAAVVLVVWAAAFWLLARDAPGAVSTQGVGQMVRVLSRERLAWYLALFYFFTFGGFVAFSFYLPTLLADQFGLAPGDAGVRTAGFVVLAVLMRPVGGWLADQIGGARVLSLVFLGVLPFALLLAWSAMVPFTVGALGCAALMGAGSGAVSKLVPQYFPAQTGTVTGLVGAIGGLGGFFPPLLLGAFRDAMGVVWPGFVLLAAAAAGLWVVNRRVLVPDQQALERTRPPGLTRTADRLHAGAWASMWTALLIAAIVVGSRNLQNFDPPLVIYTFAIIFATWGVVYHYAVWLQKPPTRMYWQRGFELAAQRGIWRSVTQLVPVAVRSLAAQRFIAERSALRWWMHQFIFWGVVLAVAITFPLVFGWIHFGTRPDDQMMYVTYVFGFPVASFRLHTMLSWVIFHGLDISAALVLTGIALALWRRMHDMGAIALQSFAQDFFPLMLLFAISVTGLALTVSVTWLRGSFFPFLAILHAITVIAALLYLPFGKFFHIFQRPAQIGVKLYQRVGEEGEGARCAACGERFASLMHVTDLKAVLPQVGFDYRLDGPVGHWQDVCPRCKRRMLAITQLRMKEQARG